MSREAHVRFWESAGVKLPRATHHSGLLQLTSHRIFQNEPTERGEGQTGTGDLRATWRNMAQHGATSAKVSARQILRDQGIPKVPADGCCAVQHRHGDMRSNEHLIMAARDGNQVV